MKIHFTKKTCAYFLCMTMFFMSSTVYPQVTETAQLDYPGADKNLGIVKKAMKAYETGDWNLLRKQVHKQATFYNLGNHDSLSLEATIAYWTKGRNTATPDLSEDGIWLPVRVEEGPRKGDWVLHWGTNILTYPDGSTIQFPYHVATKLENAKVSEAYFYYDNNKIIRAMGYAIVPPLKEIDTLPEFDF